MLGMSLTTVHVLSVWYSKLRKCMIFLATMHRRTFGGGECKDGVSADTEPATEARWAFNHTELTLCTVQIDLRRETTT